MKKSTESLTKHFTSNFHFTRVKFRVILWHLEISVFTLNVSSPTAHLEAEYKVAADTLLSDDVLHGAKRGAQVGVEKLSGQETHRGGHQVVWQGHVCDLKTEKHITNF